MKAFKVIAMDGPGGVGKSTTARALAGRLGYYFLSSGRIYRALAWVALGRGWKAGSSLAEGLLDDVRIEVETDGVLRVNGEQVGEALGSDAISEAASRLSTLPAVRDLSNRVQRETVARIAERGNFPGVILEGRDIGTVVFPETRHKFFLIASAAVRAQRRFAELRETDPATTLEQVTRSLATRDARDAGRDIAPLKPAADARVIDTSALSLEQVVETLVRAIAGDGSTPHP
jgi:cytidylate kinase